MNAPRTIEKLRADHNIADFDCGREELNRFLTRFALTNQQAGAAQTYVAVSDEAVSSASVIGALKKVIILTF